MNEKMFYNPEKEREFIPTKDEVEAFFTELFEGNDFETVRIMQDNKGLAVLDVVVISKEGELEYSYVRKGRHRRNTQSSYTKIESI